MKAFAGKMIIAMFVTFQYFCSIQSFALQNEKCDFSKWSPVRISEFVPRSVIHRVIPEYPKEALNGKMQGIILVKILVGKDGNVKKACAMETNLLGEASEKAALKWKFRNNFGLDRKRYADYAEAIIEFEFKISSEGEYNIISK
jgi:hypothetical protein